MLQYCRNLKRAPTGDLSGGGATADPFDYIIALPLSVIHDNCLSGLGMGRCEIYYEFCRNTYFQRRKVFSKIFLCE